MTKYIRYFIDRKVHYIINGERFTEEQVEEMREADRKRGYEDRKAHVYDKWYRYNRFDDGKAYDEGCVRCVNEKHSAKWFKDDEEEFRIIPA